MIDRESCPVCGAAIERIEDTLYCSAEWEHYWIPVEVIEESR